ncbi:uncharacterized protein TRAVEDRAFT_32647, partial [Trametes versicolor FP-101664 SS1]
LQITVKYASRLALTSYRGINRPPHARVRFKVSRGIQEHHAWSREHADRLVLNSTHPLSECTHRQSRGKACKSNDALRGPRGRSRQARKRTVRRAADGPRSRPTSYLTRGSELPSASSPTQTPICDVSCKPGGLRVQGPACVHESQPVIR